MTRWQEIKEALIGPSRKPLGEARQAIRNLMELWRIRKDEACFRRLVERGYLDKPDELTLYRKLLAKVRAS